MTRVLILFLLFAIQLSAVSQVLPKEGSRLNYRLIGFSFPVEAGASSYKIEIASGHYKAVDSFAKNIVAAVNNRTNKIIAEVPAFGSEYTWHVIYSGKKDGNKSSPLYHFSTQMNVHVDTTKLRLRIMQPASAQYKDDYVAVDAGGVLYDMKGRAVWYVPDTNGYGGNVACMEFTPEGTITFIYKDGFEINYNGDVLWKTPTKKTFSLDSAHGEFYHHEFVKLSNGHYMALGMQFLMCKAVTAKDSNYIIMAPDSIKTEKNGFKQGRFGRLIEYDEKGNIVWMWQSLKYMLGADFAYFNPPDTNTRYDAHDNAFFFDEKNKVIYVGFKYMNRIIAIEYPSGKVLHTYGAQFKPGDNGSGRGLFCGQHSIGCTSDGYLSVFNNNVCRLNAGPTVVLLQEPAAPSDTIRKVWELSCPIEGPYTSNYGMGGNVRELPDRSLFINMGSKYSKLFIVNRERKTLWSALPERYLETEERWVPNYEYRANIITRKDLETMIWKAEKP